MNVVKQETVVELRCKAFEGEGVRVNRVIVPVDSVLPITLDVVPQRVRVWDSVAGYFTSCHSLSRAASIKARQLALGQ